MRHFSVNSAVEFLRPVSRFFVSRPRLAAVVTVLLTLLGVYAALTLPTSRYPMLAPQSVSVSCSYPGASAGEVMNTIAGPLENQVNGVENMIYMSSSCSDSGSYSLTVNFELGTDRDFAMMKLQNLAQQALPLLPQEVKNTGLTYSIGASEVLGLLTLSSPGRKLSPTELCDYLYGVVQPAILRIPGVGKLLMYSNKMAVRVWIDPQKMAALGLNAEEVISAIRQQNVQASLGSVGAAPTGAAENRVFSLIAKGRLKTIEEFGNIVVHTDSRGGLVRLKDIGRAEYGLQSYNYDTYLGEVPCAQMYIYLLPGADGGGTMKRIKDEMASLARRFPADLRWEMSYDATDYMYASMKSVAASVGLAMLVVFVFACLVFRSVRDALVPSVFVPLSLAPAFACMSAQGCSLNILSCLAFAPAVGLALYFSLTVGVRVRALIDSGLKPAAAAESAIDALTPPLAVAALLVLAVFVPIGFINGLTGVIYHLFATVLAGTAFFSAANALVAVPAFCARTMRPRPARDSRLAPALERPFVAVADAYLRHPSLALASLVLVALAALAVLKGVPTTLVPSEDTGTIRVNCRMAEGTSMDTTAAVTRRLAAKIAKIPGVKRTNVLCGESDFGGAGENQGLVLVVLDDWNDRRRADLLPSAIIAAINKVAEGEPSARVEAVVQVTVPGMGWSSGISLTVEAHADSDPIRLARESHRIAELINASPLFDLGSCGYSADTPRLRVKVDRDKCQLMKVPLSTLFATMQYYLGSLYVNDVNLGTQVNRVTVEADWKGRATPEAVNDLFVRSSTGAMIPLGALVTFEEELGPRVIYRWNQYVYCAVNAIQKPGVSSGEAIAEAARIAEENLPSDYAYGWSGMTFHEMRGLGNAGFMAFLAVLMAYALLVGRFESFVLPFAALLPTVGTLLGAAVGLKLAGGQLALCSQIAVVLTAVLGMMTAIPIIETTNSYRASGWAPAAAARVAFAQHFRPMAVAILGFALAMLALAFAGGASANGIRSLGTAAASAALGQLLIGVPFVPAIASWRSKGRIPSMPVLERAYVIGETFPY